MTVLRAIAMSRATSSRLIATIGSPESAMRTIQEHCGPGVKGGILAPAWERGAGAKVTRWHAPAAWLASGYDGLSRTVTCLFFDSQILSLLQ